MEFVLERAREEDLEREGAASELDRALNLIKADRELWGVPGCVIAKFDESDGKNAAQYRRRGLQLRYGKDATEQGWTFYTKRRDEQMYVQADDLEEGHYQEVSKQIIVAVYTPDQIVEGAGGGIEEPAIEEPDIGDKEPKEPKPARGPKGREKTPVDSTEENEG
jgi:hypothetical protein